MIRVFQPWIFIKDYFHLLYAIFSKQISGTSGYVLKFENRFKEMHNSKYAVAVSNGSVALDLALKSLNLQEDDEVILPSFTIISCLSAVIRAGAVPVFCDVSIDHWNMTLNDIKRVQTAKTKAILNVHTYGLPSEIKEIKEYCLKNNIILIEDSAEAHGIKYENQYCGTYGDISTFSFYANKHITSGEGGMIITNNHDVYEELLKMRNLDFDNSRRFIHESMYWNYRIGGLQAALGYSQIGSIKKVIRKKQKQGKQYAALLESYSNLFQFPSVKFKNVENNYWVFGIVLKYPNIRDQLIENLLLAGIETRPFFWPLHLQPFYLNSFENIDRNLSNSEYIGQNGLYLPMGSHINGRKQKKIINKVINETTKLINKNL